MSIEKPDWSDSLYNLNSSAEGFSCAQDQWLNEWFAAHITPINEMLKNGVEVYSNKKVEPDNYWNGTKQYAQDTHKALLINITEIKKESAEDVLAAIVKEQDKWSYDKDEAMDGLLHRARAVLENKEN